METFTFHEHTKGYEQKKKNCLTETTTEKKKKNLF